MKIKTIDKLYDLIAKDLAWRKKELIELKLLIHDTKNPLYLRAGLALLSAHFEGFVKQIANYYVVFVSTQKIPFLLLKPGFSAIYSKKKMQICAESKKTSTYSEFLTSLLTDYNGSIFCVKYANDSPIIKTNSNPSSDVFEDIVCTIGLDFSIYETKRNYIDTDLLSNRHKIVHGEKTSISISDFDQTFEQTMMIIERFQEQIINAAIHKDYLKIID